MMSILIALVHFGATSCSKIKSGEDYGVVPRIWIGQQYYVVEEHSEGANLLENAMEKKYSYSQSVEFNMQRLMSESADFNVRIIRKEGPDWTGFMKYTVTYQRMNRQVFNLYYTVKRNFDSWDDTVLFRSGRFLKDSVIDLFPNHQQESDFDCKIIGINIDTCWPRRSSPYAFCTFEVKFKHPLLTNEEEVNVIDVHRRYTTTEYDGEYNGIYVQVNGKGAFAKYDPKDLPTGKLLQISSLDLVGGGGTGTWSPALHVFRNVKEVISFIFGGESADYYANLKRDGKCVEEQACTLEISWGVNSGCTMSNFAIQKSVVRANDNLTLLSANILQDGWTIKKISSRAWDES